MGNVIFATQNFFDNTLVNSIQKSSENATYPITNMYRFQRRGRTYRTDGNMSIVAGVNDQIKFTDSSSTVTATIAAGDYIYDSTFLTAVKTAMDAVSVDTFTVTVSGSNRFTIASDGTTFELLLTDVAFTAADTLGYSTVSNLTGALSYEADFVRIHTNEWITVDMGVPLNPEAVIMIGRRNTNLNISESALIKLQGHHFDIWDAPEFETTISWHENVLFKANPDGLHTEPLRYWRFYVEDKDNSLGFLEFSNFFIGQSFVPSRGCFQFGLQNGLEDFSDTVFSESGVALTDIRPQTENFRVAFDFMTKEDQDELRFIFETYGVGRPFFIVMDPNGNILPDSQDFVKYVRFTREPVLTLDRPNLWNATLEFREEL